MMLIPLDIGPVEEIDETQIDDIDFARGVIKLLKKKVCDLKEDIEDIELQARDDEQRRG